MIKQIRAVVAIVAGFVLGFTASISANADEWPLKSGDYWEITGIDIADGGGLKYATWLADTWKNYNEYAKERGWIKDYMIFANIHNRVGEPDLYLVRVYAQMPTGPEGDKRGKEFRDWASKSIEKLVGESGNRAEFRKVEGTVLLQHLMVRE